MDSELVKKIQDTLESEYPRGSGNATQSEPMNGALEALSSHTGRSRKEIIWRSVRLYMYAYLSERQEIDQGQ